MSRATKVKKITLEARNMSSKSVIQISESLRNREGRYTSLKDSCLSQR